MSTKASCRTTIIGLADCDHRVRRDGALCDWQGQRPQDVIDIESESMLGLNEAFYCVRIDALLPSKSWCVGDVHSVRVECVHSDGARSGWVVCESRARSFGRMQSNWFSGCSGIAGAQFKGHGQPLGGSSWPPSERKRSRGFRR